MLEKDSSIRSALSDTGAGCGAVLVDGDIFITHNVGQPGLLEVDKLMFNAARAASRARTLLDQASGEFETCLGMIFDVVAQIFAVLWMGGRNRNRVSLLRPRKPTST
jgi:hypothetical protein